MIKNVFSIYIAFKGLTLLDKEEEIGVVSDSFKQF
jgi:hypothetical protein